MPRATRSLLNICLQSTQSLNRRMYFLSECLSRAPLAIIVLYCTTYRLNVQFKLNKHKLKFVKRFQVTNVSSVSLWRRFATKILITLTKCVVSVLNTFSSACDQRQEVRFWTHEKSRFCFKPTRLFFSRLKTPSSPYLPANSPSERKDKPWKRYAAI